MIDKNQKQALAILGGLAVALLIGKRISPFAGSYNDDEEENQYQKALRLIRQARQEIEKKEPMEEQFSIEKLRTTLDEAAGYTLGHITSSDDSDYTLNEHVNWKPQQMYWDNVDTSGRWKKHMDTTWHTEDDE